MSLIWHIAWKDLQRLRWAILGFCFLIGARLGLGAVLISGLNGASNWFLAIISASYVLMGLQMVTAYFLVAAFIHQDPIASTTAFWTTRPISGTQMLAAKLTGLIVALGVIPILLMLPWWLGCGYGPREIASAAIETLLWQALVSAIALPIATLSDGLSRYLVWTLILIAALATLALSLQASPMQNAGDFAKAVAAAALFLIGGMTAAILHFCLRRYFLSVSVIGISAIAAVCAFFYLPLTEEMFSRGTKLAGSNTHGISLALERTYLTAERRDEVFIGSAYLVDHVPPDFALGTLGVEHRWELGGSTILGRKNSLNAAGGVYAARALGLEPSQVAQSRPFYSIGHYNLRRSASEVAALVSASSRSAVLPSIARRIQNENPPFTLQAYFQLFRPVVLGEKPTRVGEKIGAGSEVSRIVSVNTHVQRPRRRNGGDGLPVDGDPSYNQVVMLTEHVPLVWDRWIPFIPSWPGREYFLINRLQHTATSAGGGIQERLRIGTVGICWRFLDSGYSQSNWFENATLAVIALRPDEVVRTELHVDKFRWPANYGEGTAP
ncbi:MAG: hypothetical protein ABIO94_13050 [Opitutaceae bacterium]